MKASRIVLVALLVLTLMVWGAINADAGSWNGYVNEYAPESPCFNINAGSRTYIEVTFSWSSGMDPRVKVYGEAGYELGDFRLIDGNILQLTGGGRFMLCPYSSSGKGSISAWW